MPWSRAKPGTPIAENVPRTGSIWVFGLLPLLASDHAGLAPMPLLPPMLPRTASSPMGGCTLGVPGWLTATTRSPEFRAPIVLERSLLHGLPRVIELVLEPLLGGFGALEIRIGDKGQSLPVQDNELYPRIRRRISVKAAHIRPARHVLRARRQLEVAVRVDEYPMVGVLFRHRVDRDERCGVHILWGCRERGGGFGWICTGGGCA